MKITPQVLHFICKVTHATDRDKVTAQYFDMMFQAGWQMAKNQYKTKD